MVRGDRWVSFQLSPQLSLKGGIVGWGYIPKGIYTSTPTNPHRSTGKSKILNTNPTIPPLVMKVKPKEEPYPELLEAIQEATGITPTTEFRFHPKRRWRFDYAFPKQQVALEIEGGIHTQGRHTRGKGYSEDMKKYNAALLLGWKVLRYSSHEALNRTGQVRILDDLNNLLWK